MNLIAKTGLAAMLFAVALSGCRDNGDNQEVPYVPVDIYIHTTDPLFFDISVPGGWEYVTGGSQGLLVYRRSNDEFMVFDRHCPYQVDDNCQVSVDSTFTSATDPCCESRFLIIDGSVTGGPSTRSLKQYNTTFDGSVLHIFN